MYNSDRLIPSRVFAAIDSLLVGLALIAAFYSADQAKLSFDIASVLATRLTVNNLLRAAAIFSLWSILMRLFRVYSTDRITHLAEASRIAAAVAATTFLLFNSFGQQHRGTSVPHISAGFALFCLVSLFGIRALAALLSHHSGLRNRRVVIVGTGPRALRSFRHLRTKLHRTHSLLGFVDIRNQSLSPGETEAMFLGPLSSLESILLTQVVDEVIIALPALSCYAEIDEAVQVCSRVGIEVKYPCDIFPSALQPGVRANVAGTAGLNPPMLTVRPAVHDGRLAFKRLVDIACSSLALVVLAPLMLGIAVLVTLTSQGPALFLQERHGLGRRRFSICKFRTMVVGAESQLKDLEILNEASGPAFKMRHDPRVTKLGAFLRRTSLDELPQLLNVLAGDMSLVGPRPMSVRDVSLFSEAWLMRRFSVKPGITCLWQVNGRSSTSFKRWIELDLHYIDNWSLGLDAKILALTIPAVVRGHGAM